MSSSNMAATCSKRLFIGSRCFRFMLSPKVLFYSSKSPSLNGRKTSSQQWLKRQWSDPYVKKARTENYRCRSAFKLLELDEKFRLLHPGAVVIDCGAAPGSWTQVAVEKVCSINDGNGETGGMVVGIDLQHMLPVDGAFILHQSDFTTSNTQEKIFKILNGRSADVVLSDMAPRASGQRSLDHELIIDLCFSVLVFANKVLRPGGHMVCKLWQGGEQQKLERAMHSVFDNVKVAKPASSRSDSAEAFLIGRHFRQRK